jgi:hypothetical protein
MTIHGADWYPKFAGKLTRDVLRYGARSSRGKVNNAISPLIAGFRLDGSRAIMHQLIVF